MIRLQRYPPGTLFILRHGETRATGERRFIGRTDIPLNAAGRRQAHLWATRFVDVDLERIVSSDLCRTRETAAVIGRRCGLAAEAHPRLRELDLGSWEDLTFREVRQRYGTAFEERGLRLAEYRPPGGESFRDLQARVVACLEALLAQTPGRLLLVGHAGVNRVWLCHLLGMPLAGLFRLGQDPAALSIVERRADGPRLVMLNQGPPRTCVGQPGQAPPPEWRGSGHSGGAKTG